jgi:hypothetical protein
VLAAPGLMERFRAAEPQIEWRPVPGAVPRRRGLRVAHLFQEEARVELRERAGTVLLRVDSGPVGALVLLLETDRRGPPARLASMAAGRDPLFAEGALVAAWGATAVDGADGPLPWIQVVELARYALP